MGSGIGSIPVERLVNATAELLRATIPGEFKIATRPVPLFQFEQAWTTDNPNCRTVFTIGAP